MRGNCQGIYPSNMLTTDGKSVLWQQGHDSIWVVSNFEDQCILYISVMLAYGDRHADFPFTRNVSG
jgi:hypothetical protein